MLCPTLILLFGAFLVTGCASYTAAPISAAETAQSLDSRSLGDLQLRDFIAAELGGSEKARAAAEWHLSTLTLAALYFQPDMAIADAKLAAAQAAIATARAPPNPSLSLANVLGTAAVAGAIPAGAAPITVGPTINFLVETFGKREQRTAQAERLAEAARWDLATAAWQARARVRGALLDLWAARRRLALSHQQLDLEDQLVRLLEQRLAAGSASSVDVMVARVARTQTALSIRNLEQTGAVARTQLATAIGVPVRALEGVPLSLWAFDRPPAIPARPDTSRLRREALTNRSDVQASLQAYEAAQSALRLQVANQYPNITLSPGYNYNFGVEQYMLGLAADPLPILNQNHGPIAEALAARQEAASKFMALQARIIGAIDEAAASYWAAVRSVATADTLLGDDKRRASQILTQFNAGQVDRETLVTSQLGVAATALAQFDAVVSERHAIGAIEDALQQPLFDPRQWPAVQQRRGSET